MIDFKKLSNNQPTNTVEPRDIFMGLPSRDKRYEYPRDVQTEVWKQWFEMRNQEHCIIKMNTGSGKTIVGLLILKSCLNEGAGPAVFVVPDNYLVNQVCEEAKLLGLDTTTDPDSIPFLRKRSILVTNIQTLVNGKSKFGMRASNNIEIGSVIIDDVHACLATIEKQYTINIPSTDSAYSEIVGLFEESLKSQSESKYSEIIDFHDPYQSMLIPFWSWQEQTPNVYSIINRQTGKDYSDFNFQLIKDCLALCECVISAKEIEITPPSIPIHKIRSFISAKRKIYMSATLSNDSTFVTGLDVDPNKIQKIISPEKANDIGDRLILFPQVINKRISDDEIKRKLAELSATHNIVVIVPSYRRAEYWRDVSSLELNASNMVEGIHKLKNEHVGITVLINKYDGVDLPDEACRLLVIDGLPNMRSNYDAYEQNATPNNKRLCSEQIQKIEQGMGRGVRSNTDYCSVILMGRELADILYTSGGYNYFSQATKAQYNLSEELWEQLEDNSSIDDIMELTEYSLSRNRDWITVSKERLSEVVYPTTPNFDNFAIADRKAFGYAERLRYAQSVETLQTEANNASDPALKGLLKQKIAKYTNFINPAEAQEILLSAHSNNMLLLHPIQGIQYQKKYNNIAQSQFLVNQLNEREINANSYILKINSLLEKMVFKPETYKQFESSLKELSFLLGIPSYRPEDECGKGPDNFWVIGNSEYFVIECKNGTITDTINKHDCNQLNGSINWFDNLYMSTDATCYPILIHNSNVFEYACSPNANVRIMTPTLLDNFKKAVEQFSVNLVKPENYSNVTEIERLLRQFNLTGKAIIEKFTSTFTIQKR